MITLSMVTLLMMILIIITLEIAYFDEKPKNMLDGDDLGNDDVDDDDTGNDNIDDKPEHVLSGDNWHLAQLALLQRHL